MNTQLPNSLNPISKQSRQFRLQRDKINNVSMDQTGKTARNSRALSLRLDSIMKSYSTLTVHGQARRLRALALKALTHYSLDVARLRRLLDKYEQP